MSTAKKIVTNSTLLLVSEVIEKLMRFVLVVFSARYLGDEGYGKFAFALAFTQLFLILMDLGIHQLLIREIARKPDQVKKYLGNALLIKLVLCFMTLLIIFGTARLTNKPQEVLTTVWIMAGFQVLFSFTGVFRSVFQALLRMLHEAIATLLLGGLTTVAGIIVLILGGSFQSLALCYLFGASIVLIYCIWIISKILHGLILEIDVPFIKSLIREGLPFGILYFFAMMYTYIDTVMLSLIVGDQAVGWYNAAHRFMLAMMFIPSAVMKAIFPVLSKYYKDSLTRFIQLFTTSFKIMFLIGFSFATVLCVLSNPIIQLVYGDEFLPASAALRILVWSTALVFITTVMTHTTRASNRQTFTARVVFGGAVLNVFLNSILIPRFSYIGAAFATFLTQGFTFSVHFIYLYRLSIRPPFFKLLPKIVIINSVLGAVLFIISDVSVLLLPIAAIGIFALMLVTTRYINSQEWSVVKDIVKIGLKRT